MDDDQILGKDIPAPLIDEVGAAINRFTIAFIDFDTTRPEVPPVLLGSGVLVSAGKHHAILTADHVLGVLPKDKRLCLLLEPTHHPHSLDRGGIEFLHIDRGAVESEGPDLGAVLLAPTIAAAIEAKKVFFNLDLRRDQVLERPLALNDGTWFAQGFLAERSVINNDADSRGRTAGFYQFAGVGVPEVIVSDGQYDYFDFPVSHEARDVVPARWGGMSGGGLWQVQLRREAGRLVHLPPVLSGLLFYQWPTSPTVCGVKAHGRRSLYDTVHRVIGRGSSQRFE